VKEKQNKNTGKEKSRRRRKRRKGRHRDTSWITHLLIHLNIPSLNVVLKSVLLSLPGRAALSLSLAVINSGNAPQIQLNWRITGEIPVQTFS
jgi:hypothetical protein